MSKFSVSILLLCTLTVPGFSQSITASLEGVVRDPSDAAVPGAGVQVRNQATNVVTSLTTDSEGRFLAPSLSAGVYSIRVNATGFKVAERNDVELQVNQSARLELKLEVGASTETIEVTAQAPLLDSASSTVGQVVSNRSIVNLPLNSRNSWSLVFLAPGVTGNVGDKYNNVNISINGGRPGSATLMVDGIPSATALTNPIQGFTAFPGVDSVQEFKVETNNYSAEFGRSGSGVVNLVYKSGTNDLHGSVFEFLRNSVLDANNWFSNANKVPLASFKRNQYGTTVSGPLLLPKIYNGRNKTFWLFGYEAQRQRTASNLTTTVPTALQRAGDFSQTRNAAGNLIAVYDPATTTQTGSTFVRQPFAGNVIPSTRFDAVAANVVKYYPLPTGAGNPNTGANNYFAAGAAANDIDNFDGKVDENINDKNRFFVRASRRLDDSRPGSFFPDNLAIAQGGIKTYDTFINSAVDYTYSQSATLLFDIRAGFGRSTESRIPRGLDFDPTQLGFPSYMNQARAQIFPGFSPAGYYGLGNGGQGQWGPAGYNTFFIGLNNTKVLSHHFVKFGFDWRVMQANISQGSDIPGTFNFARDFTQGPNANQASNSAGDALASMLLGLGSGQIQLPRSVATQSEYYAWYIADDWKVTSKLTLNLGLRYSLDRPLTERYDRMNIFDTSVASPLAEPSGLTNLKGALVFVNSNGLGRRVGQTDKNDWDPRFGFAYQARQTTVIRGAFGIFHAPTLMAASGIQGATGYGSTTSFISAPNGVSPVNYLRDPFPGGLLPITGSSQGLATGVGTPISSTLLGDYVTPYTENWSFNVQQQLPANMTVEAGYVGAHGLHLSRNVVNLNQLRPEQLSSNLQKQVANPFYGVITSGVLSTTTVPYSYLAAPFPQYQSVSLQFPSGSSSIYHSFQLKTEKRFSAGLSLLFSYTFQKLIDDNSATATVAGANAAAQNIYDMRSERSLSANDISQVATLSYVYELPFGRGRHFGAHWNRLTDLALGGWQVNGIFSRGTGLPVAVTTQNTSGSNSATLRPNNNGKSAELSGQVQDRLTRYFDTSVFSQPAPFTFGNTGRVLPDVRIPGVKNLDLSVFKTFSIAEKLRLQFRAEAFNLTNTPQFGRPNSNLNSPQFGVISTQANNPRQMQFALKLLF